MNKKYILIILIIILVSFLVFKKKPKKIDENIPETTSNQEYIMEELLDSFNESFKGQIKILGGQSVIELRNDLSYAYQGGKKEGQNGVCVRYSKITNSKEQISFPTFSFGPEYKKNIDYKPAGQKDYSVFYKEKKVSCDVVYKDQTLNICCLYYNGPDPRSN